MNKITEFDDFINIEEVRAQLKRNRTFYDEDELLFLEHLVEQVPDTVRELINDDYFEQYVMDMADDEGCPSWLNINWTLTAQNIQQDYRFVMWGNGTRFWYRR